MQGQAAEQGTFFLCKLSQLILLFDGREQNRGIFAIKLIYGNGMAEVLHMYPYLVGGARPGIA